VRSAALVVAAVLLGACAELPAVTPDTCGNGVVEGVEECDGTEGCGASDGSNACFLVCDASGTGCPAEGGYQCGGDQRCRVPTETFAVGAVQSAGAYGVSAVDMDGDGARDLLGYDSRGLLIRWGDWEGVLGSSTRLSLPLQFQETTTLDVDFNGHRDVALPIASLGFGLFLGDGARGMSPAAQSAIDLEFGPGNECLEVTMGSIRVDGSQTGEPQLLMTLAGTFMGFLQDDDSCVDDPDFDCLISATPGPLVDGRFISAPLGYGPINGVVAAEQFSAAVVGQNTVSVWGEDIAPDNLRPQRVAMWSLDQPFADDGHLNFADLDGDGCKDLVADTGTGGSLQVAYSQLFFTACAGLQSTITTRPRPPGTPIGIGDITGDGRADVIFTTTFTDTGDGIEGNAIFGWDPEGGGVFGPIAALQEAPLSAVVLDYNHDGWRDIVVTYDGVQVVDFFLNYDGVGFSRFPIEVGGVPRVPVVGDFDGDLLEDIVVSVVDPTDPLGNDRAVAIYGEASGRPIGAQYLGDFVSEARPIKVEGGVQATTDSVMLVSNRIVETVEDCDHRLSVLIGDTSRQPVSPYIHLFSREAGAPEPMFPIGVVDMSGAAGPRVLAMGLIAPEAATDPDVGISVLGFDGTNYIEEGTTDVLSGGDVAVFELLSSLWRTGDLDGDGDGDALTLTTGKSVKMSMGGGDLSVATQDLPDELFANSWFDLVDMDADGDLDVIGNGQGGPAPAGNDAPVAPASHFWMVENDGGALDFGSPVTLAMPDDLYCVAAEVIVSDPSGRPQVIASCYRSTAENTSAVLAIGTFDPDADPENVSAVRTLTVDGELFALEVADFTGDGLEDIAVVGTVTTTILRQCRADEVFFGTCTGLDPL
jgi:hypothetical protein